MRYFQNIKDFLPWIVTLITSVVGFFWGQRHERRKMMEGRDRANYERLINELPMFQKLVYFFWEQDFQECFELDAFFKFTSPIERRVCNPQERFHSKKLNEQLFKILKNTNPMGELICVHTFPEGKFQTIRRVKYGSLEDDLETGKKLNEYARLTFNEYCRFLELAKKELLL